MGKYHGMRPDSRPIVIFHVPSVTLHVQADPGGTHDRPQRHVDTPCLCLPLLCNVSCSFEKLPPCGEDSHRKYAHCIHQPSLLQMSRAIPFACRSLLAPPTPPIRKLPIIYEAAPRRPAKMSRSHFQSSHPAKLKPPPRPFFSCGIFGNCTQSVLSPTAATPPSTISSAANLLPSPPAALPTLAPGDPPSAAADPRPRSTSSSSSSSSSTSQSFTQWRFPLDHPRNPSTPPPPPPAAELNSVDLAEAFRAAEAYFASGANLSGLRLLERSLAPADTASAAACPPAVMSGVVAALRDPSCARPAAKVLLALLLAEPNRTAAVAVGAVPLAADAVAAGGTAAERALAALELMCTTAEGAEAVAGAPVAAAAVAGAAEGMAGRGRECAVGVLAAVYGGTRAAEAPPEVARAAVAAMQGECSARGRRKGAQLLKALQETGRLDLAGDRWGPV